MQSEWALSSPLKSTLRAEPSEAIATEGAMPIGNILDAIRIPVPIAGAVERI
jgi:hypothetical protein